ncbi:hypothetical protein CL619_03425 [archaeon]|nr:hypothetical protein [archaeon]|tara:strand:- start:6497 stop:7099 length:603 start_codon:yes stop_codon:yes gene_type:complete
MKLQELRRQILHIITGTIILFGFYYDLLSSLSIFLILISGIILSFIVKYQRLVFISDFLELFQRQEEQDSVPAKGAIFFFLGVLLATKIFTKDIALASIAILTFGDSISHIFGKEFGRVKNFLNNNSKKALEGSIFGAVCAFFGAVIFVRPFEAFLASFIAMFAELAEMKLAEEIIDDNLLIPLVAGTVITLLRKFFVGF